MSCGRASYIQGDHIIYWPHWDTLGVKKGTDKKHPGHMVIPVSLVSDLKTPAPSCLLCLFSRKYHRHLKLHLFKPQHITAPPPVSSGSTLYLLAQWQAGRYPGPSLSLTLTSSPVADLHHPHVKASQHHVLSIPTAPPQSKPSSSLPETAAAASSFTPALPSPLCTQQAGLFSRTQIPSYHSLLLRPEKQVQIS